jgi:hypothetical protein
MTRFFAGVLSVIAVGVLFIAYGLLNPRADAFAGDPRLAPTAFGPGAGSGADHGLAQPAPAPAVVYVDQYGRPVSGGYAYAPSAGYAMPAAYVTAAPQPVQPMRTVVVEEAPRAQPRTTRVVERAPRRDWKKTALVIGGSTAAGAGVGGIIGGKKGALIGAALGGGASTIYESTK